MVALHCVLEIRPAACYVSEFILYKQMELCALVWKLKEHTVH